MTAPRPTESRASHLSRRRAVTGALGMAGLLAGVTAATAQEGTPAATGAATHLFLQACESGLATRVDDTGQDYELTLGHASGQSLFFSDRPARMAGIFPTEALLEEIAAVADDPPNAVLVYALDGSSDTPEIAVVELRSPATGPEPGSITYRVRIIDVNQGDNATPEDQFQTVTALPAAFGRATLFIDNLTPSGSYKPGQSYKVTNGVTVIPFENPDGRET